MGQATGGGGAHVLMCWTWAFPGVGLASGSPRVAAYLFGAWVPPLEDCLYVPALHVSTATTTGPAAPTKAIKAACFGATFSAWDQPYASEEKVVVVVAAAAAVVTSLAHGGEGGGTG